MRERDAFLILVGEPSAEVPIPTTTESRRPRSRSMREIVADSSGEGGRLAVFS